MLTSAFGSARRRKAMESRLRHTVETDVLEGALNIAVDKGLSQSQTFKPSDGRVIFMDCFSHLNIFHFSYGLLLFHTLL